jgi:hypothetical protein
VPITERLPPELDGAEFRAGALEVGQSVAAGAPLATFTHDSEVEVMRSASSGVLLALLLSEPLECRAGDPIAILGQPGETYGYDPGRIECVRLLLLGACSECGNNYPVNGLVQRARCTRCGDIQSIANGFWKQDVQEDLEHARVPGARGGGVTLGGPIIECRGMPPLCRKCHTLIDIDALSRAWSEAKKNDRAQLACTACGEIHSARVPPEWAKKIFEDAVFVFGEVTGEASAEPPKPVIFKCPSCLAALEIVGEKRIVRCKFCESDVYLPDDLWLHFNPASKRARWWLLFQPSPR